MPEPGSELEKQPIEEPLEVEEVLEAEPYEPIMDGIVFTEVKKKKEGVEYRSSDPNRKIIMLSEKSEKPKPGKPYKVKIIEDTNPSDPNKGKLIGEIYYESQDEKAKQFIEEINALKQTAKTKEDFEQLARLFKEVERLYEKGESRELEPWLAEQYDRQVAVFHKLKLLVRNIDYDASKEDLSPGAIDAIDEKEYKFPSKSELAELIEQNRELVEKKKEQGFTQLLITPFGIKLEDLVETYKRVILDHHQRQKLLAAKKSVADPNQALELDESRPVYMWDGYKNADTEGKLVYHPKEFSANHQGKTKQEVLQEQGGWSVTLLEDMPNIPRKDKGQTIEKRKQLEAGLTPKEYLQKIHTDPQYQDESGLTPEEQLMYAIQYLEQTDQVIDDYRGNGSVCFNIDAYFPSSGGVPYAYWGRDVRRAYLSGYDAEGRDDGCGVRPAVRLKKS